MNKLHIKDAARAATLCGVGTFKVYEVAEETGPVDLRCAYSGADPGWCRSCLRLFAQREGRESELS